MLEQPERLKTPLMRAISITLFGGPQKTGMKLTFPPLESYQNSRNASMFLGSYCGCVGWGGTLLQLSSCVLIDSVHPPRNYISQLWNSTKTAFPGCGPEIGHNSVLTECYSVLTSYLVARLSMKKRKVNYFTLLCLFVSSPSGLPIVQLLV